MKRAIDIMLSAVLLVVALPVVVACAIGCALALRTWPFFAQHRIGRNGRAFWIPKLRTLPPSTPRYADKYAIDGIDIPRFPRMLRRFHLDELPQLILVLTGRMSLVGPRPEMPTLHRQLDPAFAAARTSVLPGCTGLWQVSVGVESLIAESPEFDTWYLAHRSLRLDGWILWRTLRNALCRRPLITLADIPAWVARPTPAPEPAMLEPELAPAA